jgi:hypothetical protein
MQELAQCVETLLVRSSRVVCQCPDAALSGCRGPDRKTKIMGNMRDDRVRGCLRSHSLDVKSSEEPQLRELS